MGQKTNPTALRLEKTNQHYKFIWYSDRFYPQQLHHNYKTTDYISKSLLHIKGMSPLVYIKAGHQCEDIFCILPKKRFPRSFKVFNRQSLARPVAAKVLYGTRFYLPFMEKLKSRSKLTLSNSALVKGGAPKTFGEVQQERAAFGTRNLSPWVTALLYRQVNRLTPAASPGERARPGKGALVKQLFLRFAQRIETQRCPMYQPLRVKQAVPCLPLGQMGQPLPALGAAHPLAGVEKGLAPRAEKLFRLEPNRPRLGITRFYLMQASFSQQSSQFLAQRISNSLKDRYTFQRLRRQILWDCRKSAYVKGVRVTLSGRVGSKSKKAQKARARTFQWGQTELHVLSSLVQFTSQSLITPFGKIGIKVWVCYGT